jgi:ribose transport system ATP-binding protein
MPEIAFNDVSRRFGPVQALAGVSFALRAGEVHALMGENGAGKSTLIRILAGLDRPNNGHLALDGATLQAGQPALMKQAGLRFIHQELHPVSGLSVAENMFLDYRYPTRFGLVNWRALNAMAGAALQRLSLGHINPRSPMSTLGPGDQMLVRIAATLIPSGDGRAPWLYVMDEPTAALTGEESERLFAVIDELVRQGAGVLYVSHRMPEVLRICDRVTVLRDGQHISTLPRRKTDQDRIIHDMTGRDLGDLFPPRSLPIDGEAKPVLDVNGLCASGLHNIDLQLRRGEILGIGGLAGSGRGALLRTLLGASPREAGTIRLNGQPLKRRPADVWAQGLAYVPRERRSEGLMMARSIEENVVLPHLTRFSRLGAFIDKGRQRKVTREQATQMRLKMVSSRQACNELSGGNQQKALFARALAGSPSVLMLDEPTRGVDIGARFDLYRIIRSLSEQGVAILLTSSDLPELIGLSDRIAIMRDGQIDEGTPTDGLTEGGLLAQFYHQKPATGVAA